MTNRKHTKVMIYEDPMTETKPEGKALLLRKMHDEAGMERWKVCFVGEDGAVYERVIKKNAPVI